jgi:prepilin peptidase CpaA
MTSQLALVAAFGLIASAEDLWRRNISNWIPVSALCAGIAWHAWQHGWAGVGTALLGALGGFAVFLLFYLFGGMGGGDVKLMAGFGALIGTSHLLQAALWTAILGALLACGVMAFHAIGARLWAKRVSESPKSIPYAPAIAAGVLLSLVPR